MTPKDQMEEPPQWFEEYRSNVQHQLSNLQQEIVAVGGVCRGNIDRAVEDVRREMGKQEVSILRHLDSQVETLAKETERVQTEMDLRTHHGWAMWLAVGSAVVSVASRFIP